MEKQVVFRFVNILPFGLLTFRGCAHSTLIEVVDFELREGIDLYSLHRRQKKKPDKSREQKERIRVPMG